MVRRRIKELGCGELERKGTREGLLEKALEQAKTHERL
jgi:hypothetical protein